MTGECSHRGAQVHDDEAGEVYCGRCGEFLYAPAEPGLARSCTTC
jgi:hypothetical protein